MKPPLSYRLARGILAVFLLMMTGACNRDTPSTSAAATASMVTLETHDTVTCRLSDGTLSVLPKDPKRTVVLLTSLLDLWVQAGGEAVGRCNGSLRVPDSARSAVEVGSFNNPNVEKIIALKPDLVISSDVGSFRAIIPILEQNEIAYAYFNYVNYYDYVHLLELFSKLNGTEAKVLTAMEKMAGKVDDIVRACSLRDASRVLVVFSTANSVSCELPGSQVGVMLSMLGAENVIPEQFYIKGKTRIDFSLERIVQLDPDIILLNTMGDVDECRERLRKEYETNAAWSTLRAIQNDRFYVLPKEYFLYKPNDEFPDALRYLSDLLYGDTQADRDGNESPSKAG